MDRLIDAPDLQLFAGEENAPAEESAVPADEVPAADSAENTAEEAAPAISWQEAMKNPEFRKNISSIVSGRLAKAGAENAALKKELEQLKAARSGEPAGTEPAEAVAVSAPPEEAPDSGADLESRLQRLEELLGRQEQEQRLRLHYNGLQQQARELQRQLPGFSLENALEDREFLRLTSPEVGLSVESAWYALHHEGLMKEAAGEAARAISESIRSGAGIPAENGTVTRGAVSSQPRLYRNMSPEERQLQEKLILSGMEF